MGFVDGVGDGEQLYGRELMGDLAIGLAALQYICDCGYCWSLIIHGRACRVPRCKRHYVGV